MVQFSREHHFGLLLGWKIRQGLKNNIGLQRIADYVIFFFENDLKSHFTEEERTLFSKLADTDLLKQQALQEHAAIYGIIDSLRDNKVSGELLESFADALEKHIRFEERLLYNHLQRILPDADLAALAQEHPEKVNNTDSGWDDHFWIKK